MVLVRGCGGWHSIVAGVLASDMKSFAGIAVNVVIYSGRLVEIDGN